MTRFLGSVIIAAFVFMGLGLVIETTSARYKSDERALAVIQRARQAIGGDAAINNVRSMTINGKTTMTFDLGGTPRSEQADVEINMQLPGLLSKTVKVGEATGGTAIVEKKVDVVVVNGGDAAATWEPRDGAQANGEKVRTITIRKPDGTQEVITEDKMPAGEVRTVEGKKIIVMSNDKTGPVISAKPVEGQEIKVRTGHEMFRMTLALLLSAPEGLDVVYTYAGESSVDNTPVDVVDATVGGSTIKLFIDKSTSLPRMISFQGMKPVIMMFKKAPGEGVKEEEVTRIFEASGDKGEVVETQIRYSDYRNVGGVLLPHRWAQTSGGKTDVTEITNYAINPANIAEKFNGQQKVFIRKTEKP